MFTERRSFLARLRILAGFLVLAAIAGAVGGCSHKSSHAASPTVSSHVPSTPTTTLDPKAQVVARLKEILKIRDEAYRQRNPALLNSIYTSDCPCLRGDGDAIRQMIKDHAVWVGASMSVSVNAVERINDRLFIVVGVLKASGFRIEKESGAIIRTEEGRSETFRFLLARPKGRAQWLLGSASPLK
jgi:hypothetical protein